MRHLAWSTLVVLSLFAALTASEQLAAQPHGKVALPSEDLIALSSDTAEGHQQVTVIDPKLRVMSVYHVQNETGVISLKSVRSIDADLKMEEFNTESPFPREIRAILNR